jgi:hypothetical protein
MNSNSADDMPLEVRATLDFVLEGVDLETKLKVYRLIQKTEVEPGDPMFLALAAVTHGQVAIAPIPEHLKALSEEIKAHLVTLQTLSRGQIQDCRDVASDINVTAGRLSRQLSRYAAGGPSPIVSFLWAFFGAVFGSGLMLLLQRYL